MRRFAFLLASAALSFAATSRADDLSAPQKMSLHDCVEVALRHNPDVRTSVEEQRLAKAERWETGGQLFPRMHVDLGIQQWGASYVVNFGGGGFTFHDPFTWSFTATAVQPLTTLLPLLDQYHVRDLGVDIAAIRHDVARRDATYGVVAAYYRLLQAERLSEVAVQSVDQLNAQLKQANSFHDAGVVSKDDVLRAELAVAGAQQRVIQMRAQVTLSRSHLAVAMGLSPDAAIDAVPLAGNPDMGDVGPLERAEQKALADRVELRELDKHIDQSKSGVRIAWYKMAPQVNLVGSYIHNDQVETGPQFVEKDSGFIGGTLSWDVWDWGSSIAGVHAANAKLREARIARDKLRDELRLEVRQAFLNVGTATQAMTVARAAVTSAEEHYRLVIKRYEANTTTSFDVVDAESLLTQARAQLQTSIYDYLVARAALRRATGDPPEAQLRP
jgi:outer membrane protein